MCRDFFKKSPPIATKKFSCPKAQPLGESSSLTDAESKTEGGWGKLLSSKWTSLTIVCPLEKYVRARYSQNSRVVFAEYYAAILRERIPKA